MGNETVICSSIQPGHERNREYLAGREVDVSVEVLSKKRNIRLPGDFADTLQSADFYSSDKVMSARYPLLLLSNIATVMVMNEIKGYLADDRQQRRNIVNLYIKQKSGCKEVATPVGEVDLSLEFLDMLNYYLVNYTYFETKGKKVEIDRAVLLDYGEFNPIIDPGGDIVRYSDFNRVSSREQISLKTFDDVLRELQESPVVKDAVIPSAALSMDAPMTKDLSEEGLQLSMDECEDNGSLVGDARAISDDTAVEAVVWGV